MSDGGQDGRTQSDRAEDSEILYRCVREEFVLIGEDNKMRCASDAFRDPEKKPSVDRAILLEHEPQRTRRCASDAVVSLIAHEVRAIDSVVERTPTGQVVRRYEIDVSPDPTLDDPDLPDNPAHAKIHADRELNASAFKRLKLILSEMAREELRPNQNPGSR